MFDVTSETRDDTSVIILKSHLTLQVILPARASLVTPSLIDDSARPLYYTVKKPLMTAFSQEESLRDLTVF